MLFAAGKFPLVIEGFSPDRRRRGLGCLIGPRYGALSLPLLPARGLFAGTGIAAPLDITPSRLLNCGLRFVLSPEIKIHNNQTYR